MFARMLCAVRTCLASTERIGQRGTPGPNPFGRHRIGKDEGQELPLAALGLRIARAFFASIALLASSPSHASTNGYTVTFPPYVLYDSQANSYFDNVTDACIASVNYYKTDYCGSDCVFDHVEQQYPDVFKCFAKHQNSGGIVWLSDALRKMSCNPTLDPIHWSFGEPYPVCTKTIPYSPGKALGRSCPATKRPITIGTGNKYLSETDFVGTGIFPVNFGRSYNSQQNGMGAVGYDWRPSHGGYIGLPDSATALVYRPDGKVFQFTLTNGAWVSDADVNDRLRQTATGWTYTTADDTVETYSSSGLRVSYTNRAGLMQTYTYSTGSDGSMVLDANGNPTATPLPAGHVLRLTDPAGRAISFGYDASGRIVKMTDPAGQAYLYRYDGSNNLISVTYPDGKTKQYIYGEAASTSGTALPNALTGIIDENGARYASYWYDAQGRAIKEEMGPGLAQGIDQYQLTYNTDASGNPVSTVVTNPLNSAFTYTFQTILGVVKSTGQSQPGGSGCGPSASNITYDANGNVASRTDFNGNQTTYQHDLSRNLETSRTEAAGKPEARTITTQWHPTFRLPTQITEPGRVTSYTYDATTGNVLTKTVADTASGATRAWTYTYTGPGDNTLPALLKTVDGPRTDVSDITTYDYSPNGDLRSVTNVLGHTTQITSHDPHGRPLTLIDPNGLTTTLTYTPRGWLASRTVGGETTGYSYDGVGQLTRVTFPDGSYISYSYDDAHRLTDITDALGNRLHYTLDNAGNRTREDIHDAAGTLTQTRSRVFDALGRLWKEISSFNQTTQYTYDPNGNLTSVTDPLNHTTVNAYDALNRLKQVTDAANGVTRYSYDPLDQLRSITDPRNLVTQYTVNALGDQTQLVSPDTGTTNQTFDAAGNLKTSTDARGITATYSYDALNRVTQIAYTDGLTIAFQYDQGANAIGRLTKMTDPSGTTTWTYNAQGRVATKTQVVNGTSQTIAYGYDSAGRLASLTYPSGQVIGYSYDTQGRIAGLSAGGTPLLSAIQYQPFGAARAWTWGNGTAYSRSIDTDGRVSGYPLGANTRSLSFDAAARITGYTDSQPAANQVFVYDPVDRLTSWIAPNANRSFTYDTNGNRTSLTIGATQSTYGYPASSNRLVSITGSPATFGYDAAGNLVSQYPKQYAYDARGRMKSATVSGVTTILTFSVNGLGQRVNKNGLANTLFAYDEAGHLIGEYDETSQAITETVYLGDTPIAALKGGQTYYVFADQVNAPRVITNTANQVVWRWDSEPFGSDMANENPSGLGTFEYNLRFPGQYFDKETGLHYNYFRDYDPSTGRYVQSDPIGLRGGINTYSYVFSSPLLFADPWGLRSTGGLTVNPIRTQSPGSAGGYGTGDPRASSLCSGGWSYGKCFPSIGPDTPPSSTANVIPFPSVKTNDVPKECKAQPSNRHPCEEQYENLMRIHANIQVMNITDKGSGAVTATMRQWNDAAALYNLTCVPLGYREIDQMFFFKVGPTAIK